MKSTLCTVLPRSQNKPSGDVYSVKFPQDRPALKILVGWTFMLEALQSALMVVFGFQNLFIGYIHLDPGTLSRGDMAWLAIPTLTGVGAYIV